jgi:hypothetical protein
MLETSTPNGTALTASLFWDGAMWVREPARSRLYGMQDNPLRHPTEDHRVPLDVAAGRPTPLGHLQGYDFEPGDMLTMTHDGFKPVTAQVR